MDDGPTRVISDARLTSKGLNIDQTSFVRDADEVKNFGKANPTGDARTQLEHGVVAGSSAVCQNNRERAE